jgi:transaldolase
MKFFIDTANLNQIKEAHELGILDGVTTNPSLMAKEGIKGQESILKHYIDICNITSGPVSAEVLSTDYESMLNEGIELSKLHHNIVVKVPMTADGIRVIKKLSENGIKTNCTLIFSPGQALLAAKAGATYVSPFVGRLDDISSDGINLIKDIFSIFNNYSDIKTEILAASLRNPMHIIECAKAGCDVITAPLDVIKSLLKHPLTDIGLEKFIEDTKKFI